jgi:integrase/recombinase XerC
VEITEPILEPRPLSRISGEVLVEAFVRGLTPQTRRLYTYSLNSFCRWAGCSDVGQLARQLCAMQPGEANLLARNYVISIEGKSPATVNAKLQGLRSLLQLAKTLGVITWTLEVPQLKVERYRDTRGPGLAVVRQILELTAKEPSPIGVRNHALMRVLFDLALRRASVASLDLEHWEESASVLWILGKGKAQRRKKELPPPTQAALKRWVAIRGSVPGPLFVRIRAGNLVTGDRLLADGIYRVIYALGVAVGSSRKVRPHGIRHTAITAATRAARAAHLGLEAVMAFSDHKNVQTLKHYLDEEDGLQRQVSAMVAAQVAEAATPAI